MISVIIPALNERKNLQNLLPYLLGIRHGANIEVIIVSAKGDRDDYQNIVDDKNIMLLNCKGTGRAHQMNFGAKAAAGVVFAFLHADVIPPMNFFVDIKQTIDSGNEAGFFSYRFDRDGFLLDINASFTKRKGVFTGGGDQCLFIKREVFEAMDGFKEDQVLMEDFEFFERMKSRKLKFEIVQNDLVVSARKYERNSYLRVNLTNLMLVTLFKLGVSSNKLKWLHQQCLRSDYA